LFAEAETGQEMEVSSGDITITVVYENNCRKEGLECGWGFSAVVAAAEKTILFDTGPDASVLNNMDRLSIEPESIDVVFLSHIHPDHTGGLKSFLEKNPAVTVYLPKAFPAAFKKDLKSAGANLMQVQRTVRICDGVYSTGVLGRWIKEQALVLRTDKGLILLAGCAHPGIVKFASTAKEMLQGDILLAVGGFHLEWATKSRIEKTILALRKLGVQRVAPCHCTGDKARALFEKLYETDCINVGAGDVIAVKGLP
jgi:7,8-dihydropterin-6-yl-methyl-4-(beta-D-ribofuranosyl)aminobenzene 5'-phosphate synthase